MFSYFTALRTDGPNVGESASSAFLQASNRTAARRNPRRGHLAVAGRYSTCRTLDCEVVVEPKVLGQGISTVVKSARHNKSDRHFAVKTVSKKDLSDNGMIELRGEIESYLIVDHPHIATLEQVYETADEVHFLMENCEGQELFDRIVQRGRYTECQAAHAMRQMCVVLAYLHSHGIVHRDLKPENFLYDKLNNEHLKLIDFGFATKWDGKKPMSWRCGTLHYMAPEVYEDAYTEKADIWSLGVLLYTILCGTTPWHESDEKTLEMIKAATPHFCPRRFDPLSSNVKNLLKSLMAKDPAMRPTAREAISSQWLSSFHAPEPPLDKIILQSILDFTQACPVRRTCLAMSAWSLPICEHERLRDHFVALCTENCGAITLPEFVRALASYGIDCGEAELAFRSLDQDSDGEISYTDFLAGTMAYETVELDTWHLAFSRFDADGNGVISEEDLRKVLGKKFKRHGVLDLIVETAQNGQSTVSLEDFCNFMQSGVEGVPRTASLTSTQSYSEAHTKEIDCNLAVAEVLDGPKPSFHGQLQE